MLQTRFHLDDDTITVERIQDVEAILEHNKTLRTLEQRSDWARHIARIPNIILERWFNEEYARGNVGLNIYSTEMDQIVARKLRDPEWAYLRTDAKHLAGRVGFGS